MSALVHRYTSPTSLFAAAVFLAVWVGCFDRNAAGERVGAIGVALSMMFYVGASLARIIATSSKSADVVFQEGYEMGWKQGHDEGRRVGRPVVVELPRAGAGV